MSSKRKSITDEQAKIINTSNDINKEYRNFESEKEEEKKQTERLKNTLADEILNHGNEYLKEIDDREKNQAKEKRKMVKVIYKRVRNKYGTKEYLRSISYVDLDRIHTAVTQNHKSWFETTLRFLMSWD